MLYNQTTDNKKYTDFKEEKIGTCSENKSKHYCLVVNDKLGYRRDYFYKDKITVARYHNLNETIVQINYKSKYFKKIVSDKEALDYLEKYKSFALML